MVYCKTLCRIDRNLLGVFSTILVCLIFFQPFSYAQEAREIKIVNHRFVPSKITVPAGKKIKLIIKNLDPTPEEFESFDLNREKIVAGRGEITLFIGPLKKGEYGFFGDFYRNTGKLIAE
ncbi:MAG: cupredoxin domain-containing protein [Candidatus Dadabacteria bacterium]|nr:MAG: cupredoxin domain-containing protein [Candidatus Dadabacteria bacterium]